MIDGVTEPDTDDDSPVRTARQLSERLVLSYDAGNEDRTRAFNALVVRAAEAYGIALHYADDEDPDAAGEAMSHAVGAVARGFAAATLEILAQDEVLALSIDQKLHLDELIVELDLETSEILHDA
ncbi:hypothetical protein [Streptomyces sp. NPDC046976]|uniref:hypothetical protein n=1 Tax=Streptomyces sp. NPDC046976 TaxID=3155258 RepID=UPI0033C48CFA